MILSAYRWGLGVPNFPVPFVCKGATQEPSEQSVATINAGKTHLLFE